MYNGGLISFKIKDRDPLISLALTDLDTQIDENGLLLKYKKDGSIIGYFSKAVGIDFEEMMTLLGYDYDFSE